MQLTLDPYMFRRVPLTELPGVVSELGYKHIELSPRDDFMPFFLHPRADRERISTFKSALRTAGVEVASVLPLYHWSGLTRTSARRPSATGSARSRSPSSSAAQR
jgi:myo-inositol catabolism protein IolH